ncbi:MAG: hypothetical protein U0441_14130 [Polyangiaceae bacterium]
MPRTWSAPSRRGRLRGAALMAGVAACLGCGGGASGPSGSAEAAPPTSGGALSAPLASGGALSATGTLNSPSPATDGATLTWESDPFPGRTDGDDVEDVVGLMRRVPRGGGRQDIVVVAWSGATLRPLWVAGPFGDFGSSAFAVRFAASPDRALVADPRFVVHVLDRATGKEIGAVPFKDRVDFICAGFAGERQAWIPSVDRKSTLVDLDTAQATEGERPPFCARANRSGCGSPASCAGQGLERPIDEDVGAYRLFVEADVTVMSSATGEPQVARLSGVDRPARKLRWTVDIAPDPAVVERASVSVDMAGGRVFASYRVAGGGESRLVSFDAATGQRRFSVVVPTGATSVRATPTRVYVRSKDALSAFDPGDGRNLGAFR